MAYWIGIILLVAWTCVCFLVPPAVAILLGVRWWRRFKKSGERAKVHALEVTVFLLGLVPGIVFTFLVVESDERELVPLTLLASLAMGYGACLGWLYANCTPRLPERKRYRRYKPSVPVSMMNGVLLTGVWCAMLLINVPSLLPSRISSNESSAVAALRCYAWAQRRFAREDHYRTGRPVYANPRDGTGFADLYQVGGPGSGRKVLNLIGRAFAEATSPERAYAGYYFADIVADPNGPYDQAREFGLCAAPAAYNRSGRNIFIVDAGGAVHQKDAASVHPGIRSGDPVPTVAVYPDSTELTSWLLVGNVW